ncbi:MAG: hypothetical protein RIR79_634 [Pseudomonadota bacterium]|jgi:hypothetical protein
MLMKLKKALYFVPLVLLTACSHVGVQQADYCVGTVHSSVAGLRADSGDKLLQQAKGLPGKGGVCAAQAFVAVEPVTVYRLYDSSRPWTAQGAWWSMNRPSGTRESYRAQNAICKEWSQIDRLVVCKIKPHTELVLGTTQSVTCSENETYPATGDIQVYIPNNARENKIYVEDCEDQGVWPAG